MKRSIIFTLFMIILGAIALTPVQAEDLIYVPVNPCRLADTRPSEGGSGAIPVNQTRNFLVSGSNLSAQGGNPFGCVHPKDGTGVEPLAISAYVVAVPTGASGAGHLAAYASDQLPPGNTTATVNYAAGQVIGNTTNITLCQPGSCPIDGEMAIKAFSSEQHVVIDVQGYFYPQVGAAKNDVIVDFSDQIIGRAVGDGEGGDAPLIMSPQGYVAAVHMNNGKVINRAELFFAGASCTGAAYSYRLVGSETIDIGGGETTEIYGSSIIGGVSNVFRGYNAGNQLEYWYLPKTPNLFYNIPVQSLKMSVEDYIETTPDVWESVETVECYATPAMILDTAIEVFPNISAVTGFPNAVFQAPLRYDYR